MRIKPYYLAPVLPSGAAAAAIIAAPSAIVAPARPQQAGIVTTPMTGPHTGGSYCGDSAAATTNTATIAARRVYPLAVPQTDKTQTLEPGNVLGRRRSGFYVAGLLTAEVTSTMRCLVNG
jgi:hypothetical protein